MAAAVAAAPPGALKRQGTLFLQLDTMLKGSPGPSSDFFKDNARSKTNKVYRNTFQHWHVHWYLETRGRPMLRLSLMRNAGIAADTLQGFGHKMSITKDTLFSASNRVLGGAPAAAAAPAALAPAPAPASAPAPAEAPKVLPPSLALFEQGSSRRLVVPKTTRAKVWNVMENHPIVNTIIFLFITLAAASDVLETEYRYLGKNAAVNLMFVYFDYIAVSVFTVEFVVRIVCCPSLKKFSMSVMNWIDLLAVLPSYIGFAFSTDAGADSDGGVLEVCATHGERPSLTAPLSRLPSSDTNHAS